MTHDQFFVGQRVKQWDPENGCNVYGHVSAVKEKSVLIDWHDPDFGLMKDVEHFKDEFDSIKEGNPGN